MSQNKVVTLVDKSIGSSNRNTELTTHKVSHVAVIKEEPNEATPVVRGKGIFSRNKGKSDKVIFQKPSFSNTLIESEVNEITSHPSDVKVEVKKMIEDASHTQNYTLSAQSRYMNQNEKLDSKMKFSNKSDARALQKIQERLTNFK